MSAKFHDSEGTEVHPHLKREYWCFISYRHADNKEPGRQWATWLHQALETYEVPADLVGTKNERGDFIPERIFPVFRDEEELPADAELSKPIEAALRRSRFLVVLCSPQAVQSRFVADEILRFKQLGKQDRILAAIIEGEPNASDDPAKGGVEQECFPQPLRFDVNEQGQLTSERTEPIAADFRFSDGASGWTSPAACREVFKAGGLSDEQIAKSVTGYTRKQNLMLLKIVAGVLGVPLGVLTQRDKAYQLEKQKQRTRVLRRWLAVVSIASLAAVLGGVLAWRYGIKAERYGIEAEISRENLRKSYSRSDEQMARQFTDNGQYNDAVAFLTRSLRTDPANDLSSTNLLSLLANAHLIRPEIAPLALPEGASGSNPGRREPCKAGVVLAVSSSARERFMPALVRTSPPQREVVSIWNMKTGERTDYPMTPGVEVTCLDVTPDGLQAVIARNDGGVELWSLKDGKRRNLLPSLPGFVTCVAFSGNGEKLLVGSEIGADGMGGIHAWELYQPQEPARVMKQKGAVSEIATDDEGIFASSIYGGDPINLTGDDSAATTWDLRSGQPVGKPVEVDKGLLHVAIEPTHELIALGMNDGTLYVGSFRNGGEVLPPTTHSSAITSLAFSADGKSIIVGDSGGYVHIWNVGDGRLRHPTRRHDGEIFKAMAAMDTSLVSSMSEHGEVSVFDIKTGALQSARLQHRPSWTPRSRLTAPRSSSLPAACPSCRSGTFMSACRAANSSMCSTRI
jgi:hypothetical protein